MKTIQESGNLLLAAKLQIWRAKLFYGSGHLQFIIPGCGDLLYLGHCSAFQREHFAELWVNICFFLTSPQQACLDVCHFDTSKNEGLCDFGTHIQNDCYQSFGGVTLTFLYALKMAFKARSCHFFLSTVFHSWSAHCRSLTISLKYQPSTPGGCALSFQTHSGRPRRCLETYAVIDRVLQGKCSRAYFEQSGIFDLLIPRP